MAHRAQAMKPPFSTSSGFAPKRAKPELVLKGGFIAWAQMGNPNASIPTPQPVLMRPMFGGFGRATGATSVAFVSRLAFDSGTVAAYGLTKQVEVVRGCRGIGKRHMKLNDALPRYGGRPGDLPRSGPTGCGSAANRPSASPSPSVISSSNQDGPLAPLAARRLRPSHRRLCPFGRPGGGGPARARGDAGSLLQFAEECVLGLATSALPFVSAAHLRPEELPALDHRCDASLPSQVANRASRAQGQAWLRAAEVAFPKAVAPLLEQVRLARLQGHLAPVFGALFSRLGVPEPETRRLYLFQGARAAISAAVRLNVVGPLEAQAILLSTRAAAESALEATRAPLPRTPPPPHPWWSSCRATRTGCIRGSSRASAKRKRPPRKRLPRTSV